MEKQIERANEAFDLFMEDKMDEGIAHVTGPELAHSIYHNYARTSILVFKALIAFNQEDFAIAIEAADACLALCNENIRETWLEQISGSFSDEKYKTWSDEKLHTMLVRAETLFFKTALLACSSGADLMAIAKICVYSRDSYKLFEKCLDIVDIRPWSSELLRDEFINGTKFGLGMFKLYMSLLPPKILKIMEWIGFSGDGADAIEKLNDCADSGTLRSSIAMMTPFTYYFIFEFQFGAVGVKSGLDISKARHYFGKMKMRYPDNMMIRFYEGKLNQIDGKLEQALKSFEPRPSDEQSFKCACYWESYWCHLLLGHFPQAAAEAEQLINHSTWSPAVFTYLRAIALLSMTSKSSKEEARKLLGEVESLRKRVVGKSIPDEKFVAQKAHMFLNNESNLSLAIPEAAYVFNYLKVGNASPKLANFWRQYVKQQAKSSATNSADLALATMINMSLANMLSKHDEAEKFALKILSSVEVSAYKAAAQLELGHILRSRGNPAEALQSYEKARVSFTGYYFESRVHFRTFALERLIKFAPKTSL